MVKYDFIFEQQIFYPLRLLCRTLGVTKGGYLRWWSHPHSARDEQDTDLIRRIADIQAANRQTYGSPRVHAALRHQGVAVSRKRVARLMRKAGLSPEMPRIRITTTDSDHDSPIADNVIDRDFTISMSRRGNCHDNACAKSFRARLNVELAYRQRFATRNAARQSIFASIETFYNRTRIHSAIGNVTPQAYEDAYYARFDAA